MENTEIKIIMLERGECLIILELNQYRNILCHRLTDQMEDSDNKCTTDFLTDSDKKVF